MKVHFATTNRGKVRSLSDALRPYGIEVVHLDLELPEQRSESLRDIAREKVLFAYGHVQKTCIAQDAGFYIAALNGFPRTFVNHALDTIGLEGILTLLDGKSRECKFRNCLAYHDGMTTRFFESSVPGTVAEEPRGNGNEYAWSALSRIFIPAGEEKTLAVMSREEYDRWRESRAPDSFTTRFVEWFVGHWGLNHNKP